jgi:hypothetical protein
MGYPVEPYIVDIGDPKKDEVEEIVAEPHQIGWWDEGEEFEDLFSVDVRHFNTILLDYDGWVDIAMEDDEEGNIFPSLINGKITLRYVVPEEEEEWIPDAEF